VIDRYARMLFEALLPAVLNNGVQFECHPQNTLVRFNIVTKELRGIVVRDIEGIKVNPEALKASTGFDLEALYPGHATIRPMKRIYNRLYANLINNLFQELIRVLGLHYNGLGWKVLKEHLEDLIPKDHPLYEAWLSPERKTFTYRCLLKTWMGTYQPDPEVSLFIRLLPFSDAHVIS
jgi:siderophore synthetase component